MKTFRVLVTWLACVVIGASGSPLLAQQVSQTQPAQSQTVPPQAIPPQVVPSQGAAPAVAPVAAPVSQDATIISTDAKMSKGPTVTGHDLSPWGMFMQADIVVKAVMIGLAFASLVTWTVCFGKMRELAVAQRRLRKALASIHESRSLAEARVALGSQKNILAAFLGAAVQELRLSNGINTDAGIKERAASSFAELSRAEARRMRLGMGLLATIGATAPFVGLFGTVWGIMNSFIGISKSQTTNLAVVAPGIAEALLATALGLVAAIPAVIIYNHFSRVTKKYLEMVGQASGASARLLSRDLDRSHLDRSHGGAVSHAAE
jgi:biopolymer transport protein ExbB